MSHNAKILRYAQFHLGDGALTVADSEPTIAEGNAL